MKNFTLLLILFVTTYSINLNGQIFTEDFDGSNMTATTATTGCGVGDDDDYFGITNSSVTNVSYIGGSGNFLGAQDTDGNGCLTASVNPSMATISGINITGETGLVVCFDIAEDTAADGAEDWDVDDFVSVLASIDGSTPQTLFEVAGGGATNTAPGVDCDGDGIADGEAITDIFTTYCIPITSTGASLEIIILVEDLNAGDEDIAIDNVSVYSDASVAAPNTNSGCIASVCMPPQFTAIATCANGMTAAAFDEYFVSVEVTDAGSAPGDVSVSVGSFTGSITGGTGTIVLGPFNFVDGLGDQMVTVADANDLTCFSTAEVSELRCGYTPDNGPAADSATNACGTFCSTQGSVMATVTSPAFIAQAAPASVSDGDTNNTNYVYVLVNSTGDIVSLNNNGVFTSLTNGEAYTVHAFNVLEPDRASFESQFTIGESYTVPMSGECFSVCGSVTKTPDCFTCPTVSALTATSPICSGTATTDLTATIADFFNTENGSADFDVEFVYTTTQQTTSAEVYGLTATVIGTEDIAAAGVTSVTEGSFTLPNVTVQTTYYVYARILNAAAVVPDVNCRPFAEVQIVVNPNPDNTVNDIEQCFSTMASTPSLIVSPGGDVTHFIIDYDDAANTAGFMDMPAIMSVTGAVYEIPADLAPGVYNGTVTLIDDNLCEGTDDFTITINAAPVATINDPSVCMGSTTAPIELTVISGTPTMYAIDYDAAANTAGFVDVASTTPIPTAHTLPSNLAMGTYNGTITYTDDNGCSGTDDFVITVQAVSDPGMAGVISVCNADPAEFSFDLFDELGGMPDDSGTWSETTSGTSSSVLIGTGNSGSVNFQNVTAGSYEFTYTVPATGSCPEVTSTVTVTVTNCFDLALTKVLTTSGTVKPGETVNFDITVVNQGSVEAFDIDIEDYFDSAELTFVSAAISPNDTAGSGGTQFTNGFTIDQIAVGAQAIVQVTMTVNSGFTGNTIINNAEITGAASVDGGDDAIDTDSTPDSEDGTVADPNDNDTAMGDGSDDYDPATLIICQSNCGMFPWDGTN
jgi:hypothetical protein